MRAPDEAPGRPGQGRCPNEANRGLDEGAGEVGALAADSALVQDAPAPRYRVRAG